MRPVKSSVDILHADVQCIPAGTIPELNDLRDKALQGDESARTEMINKSLRLALYKAKKWAYTNEMQYEDLVSAAFEGLVVGAQRIVQDRDAAVVMCRWIDNYCARFIERFKYDFPIYLHTGYGAAPTKAASLDNYLEEYNEPYYARLVGEQAYEYDDDVVYRCLSNIPQVYREILELYFGLEGNYEHSCPQIARDLGLNERTVLWRLHKGIELFKQEYEQLMEIKV